MANCIRQEVTLDATPERVYGVLTDGNLFSAMSGGAPAEIDSTVGGEFSVFGGMIVGRNLDCVPSQRLVQAWRAKNWDDGAFSIVRIDLNAVATGTQLVLEHAGFPEGQQEHLAGGWHENYWKPLTRMLSSGD